VDDRETSGITGSGRKCGGMKKPKTKPTKSLMDTMQEIGRKYGVKVTDMSERGVRAIGLLVEVGRKMAGQVGFHSPAVQSGERGSECERLLGSTSRLGQ
jgi:hypothetical protein